MKRNLLIEMQRLRIPIVFGVLVLAVRPVYRSTDRVLGLRRRRRRTVPTVQVAEHHRGQQARDAHRAARYGLRFGR